MEILTYLTMITIFTIAAHMGDIGFILVAMTVALRLCKNQQLHYVAVLPFGMALQIILRGIGYTGGFSAAVTLIAAAWFPFAVFQRIHGTFTKEHLLDIAGGIRARLLGEDQKKGAETATMLSRDADALADRIVSGTQLSG